MKKMKKELTKYLSRNGIEILGIEKGKKAAHFKVFLPNGRWMIASATPSSRNNLRNCLTTARRMMREEISFAA